MRLVIILILLQLFTVPQFASAEWEKSEKPDETGKAWSDKLESLSQNSPKPASGWGKKLPEITRVEEPADSEAEQPGNESSVEDDDAQDEEIQTEEESTSDDENTQSSPFSHLKPGEWETFVEMDGQFFPSFLLATAIVKMDNPETPDSSVIGDRNGLIGIAIKSPGSNSRVCLEIQENLVMNASKLDAVLEKADEIYYICPAISFKFEALVKQKQPIPLSLNVSVTVNGGEKTTKPKTVLIRSINDCPTYFVSQTDGSAADISFMFASYVNESHPMVDAILQEALKTDIVDSFTGYQSGSEEEVMNQVFAIWTALQNRGIKYSSITTPSAHSENVFSQNVRFIEESLKFTQANCVDGSVLIASILYKIGINPVLVVLPDHMYLGFYLDEKAESICYLETTRLSENEGRDFFDTVLKEALEEYKKDEKKFLSGSDPDYQFIDIAEARRIGMVPIAYSK